MFKIIFFFLLLISDISYSQYPQINLFRPRIVLSGDRFNWLHAHYTSGTCAGVYNQFRYNYEHYWITTPVTYLAGNDSTQWNYVFNYGPDCDRQDMVWTALFTALLWKITNEDVMLKRIRFITSKYAAAINTMPFDSMAYYDRENADRDYGQIGSEILDWCYNDLSQQNRISLANALYKVNKDFVNYFITTGAGNSYVSSHNALNSILTLQNTFALYQAEGTSQGQQDTIANWYQILYSKWMNNFLPVYGYYRGNNGGWNWGAAYSFWSTTDNYTLFDNFLIAVNKNLYQDLPWINNTINMYWYMLRPNYSVIHLGDGETPVTGFQVPFRHAAIYNDTRSKWLTQLYTTPQFITWTYPLYEELAWRDFEQTPLTMPDMPLDWLSDKVGLATSRTSWEPNSYQIWFFNSLSKRASHEHRDNNTFEIFSQKPQIVDAGYYDSYGSSHFMNYYTRTIAHNVVCVFDSTEQFYYSGTPVSNDGGQIESLPLMNYSDIFASSFQRGKWLNYYASNSYFYCVSDASLSYNPNKLTKYQRRLLYIKPNKVIVIDNIKLNSNVPTNKLIKWVAHFSNQPVPSGNLIQTVVPGHIEVYKGGDYIQAYGNGNVAIRTLLPDSSKVTRIGGAGYEFWVNGINYPPSPAPDSITNMATPGRWRIEVSPFNYPDSIVMVHTISIGDNVTPCIAGGIIHKTSTTMSVEWGNNIALFSMVGDTACIYQRAENISGNRTISLWSSDLKRNRNFRLKLDNITNQLLLSDSNGIIQTQVSIPSGANHLLELTTDTISGIRRISNNVPDKYSLSQNFPNPFNPSTKIKFDITSELRSQNPEVVMKVFDITGREIQFLVNGKLNPGTYEVIFDGSNLPSGVYFYRLQAGNFTKTRNMIMIK